MSKALKSLFTNHKSIVLCDVETTGLNPDNDEIIELAAIKLNACIDGSPTVTQTLGLLIQLPANQTVPEKITEITGITDTMLKKDGIPRTEVAALFAEMLSDGPTLLVAHNAHFDASFIGAMFTKENKLLKSKLSILDTLTIFRDRRSYPHRLENAMEAYGVKSERNHRASDDVLALCKILNAMAEEKDDLTAYINLLGYNPKYGIPNKKLKNIRYEPQPYGQRESLIERIVKET